MATLPGEEQILRLALSTFAVAADPETRAMHLQDRHKRMIPSMKRVALLVMVFAHTTFCAPADAEAPTANAAAQQAMIASAVQAGVTAALAERDATNAAATAAANAAAAARHHATYGWGAMLGIGLAVLVGLFLLFQMLRGSMIAGVAQSSSGGGVLVLILLAVGIGCAVLWGHGSSMQETAVAAPRTNADHFLPQISMRQQVWLSLAMVVCVGFPVYLGLLVDLVRWLFRRMGFAAN
jgi:hypothetical protein